MYLKPKDEIKHSAFTVIHTVAGLKSNTGGPARSVPNLCEHIGKTKDILVHLLSQDFTPFQKDNLLPSSEFVTTDLVKAYNIKRPYTVYSPKFKNKLINICQEKKIQIIHDHGLWLPSNHAAASVARRLNIPFISHPRGMLEPWAFKFNGFRKKAAWRLYQRRAMESASVICTTSEQEFDNLRKFGFRQPIAILPNGVYLPPERKIDSISSKHTALFISRLHPVKGLVDLISAWGKVCPPNWQMVIAGPDEGGYRKIVEKKIDQFRLNASFKLMGPVEGKIKEELFRTADLFILPSYSENFGIVIAEALSYGLPAITTRRTPWRGLETHNCGWWIDLGVEPLARAIQEATLISDEKRSEMGKRGRKYTEESFSWEKISLDMISVYHWVLGKGQKPDCIHLY